MRVLLVAAMMVLLAEPAFAQDHVQRYGEEEKEKSAQQKEADKAAQEAYKRSLGNIPDQGPTDPWGAVRSNGPPAKESAMKTRKTKTGSAETKP
jgi:hypothetical protein